MQLLMISLSYPEVYSLSMNVIQPRTIVLVIFNDCGLDLMFKTAHQRNNLLVEHRQSVVNQITAKSFCPQVNHHFEGNYPAKNLTQFDHFTLCKISIQFKIKHIF